MKIRPVEAELFHPDGWTDRHDEASEIYYRGLLDHLIYHFLRSSLKLIK
jgi:hypothetical protein